MRASLPSILAVLVTVGMLAGVAQAEAVKVTPELTVFTNERLSAPDEGPTVLRGSASRRGTVHGDLDYDLPERYQIGAGERLWVTDLLTGDLIACEPYRTSRVGSRYIRCFGGKNKLPTAYYE
ncbi:MAG: hypothetical protein ACR2Q4_01030 [Geminicoccaceae bacterium]